MILLPAAIWLLPKLSSQTSSSPTSQGQPAKAVLQAQKAPPPRVQDLPVPPAPTTPGPLGSVPANLLGAPLGADEAVAIALHNQPSLGDPLGAITTARGKTNQIASAANPQVIGAAGYSRIEALSGPNTPVVETPGIGGPAGISPLFTYEAALQLRQLVYDFGQTRNLVRQSRALEGVAKANLTRAQQDLVYTVRADFYSLANAQRLVVVNEANVDNRQRQLDLANARLAVGLGQPIDVITAETSKSQAILGLNVARDGAQQARIDLLQQLGVDTWTPLTVTDEPEKSLGQETPRELTNRALRLRPEVRAAEQAVIAARYGLSAAKSLNLPSIYAAVSAGVNGFDFPLNDNTWSFGIGFQFPIFDGGQRAGAIQEAHGNITTAQADFLTTVQQVQRDVSSAYLAVQSAEQRVLIGDNEVVNAQEGVRVAEGRYSAGVGLFLDVTTAQALLLTAQTDQATSRNALDQARAQLRRATGEILPSDLLNTSLTKRP